MKINFQTGSQEFFADLATLGLTAAATVSGGAETKTILSAIATGVVGVNTAADKEYFQNNTIQALQLQMRAARSGVETSLIKGMKQSIKDYPLEAGKRDIVQYYYAGSLNDALIALVQNSGSDAKTNQAAANSARLSGNPPGPVSAVNTVISANPATTKPGASRSCTITVQAMDANGNKETASSGTVVLTASSGTLRAVADNQDGTYTATLTPSGAGTVTITVTGTIGGSAIGVPASVVFQ